MKQKLCVLVVLAALYTGRVNGQTPPRDEFEVLLPISKLSITRGQTDSVEVSIIRSRQYANKAGATLGLASSPKDGLKVAIKKVSGRADAWMLVISIDEAAEPGNYAIIPSCHLYHKVKGSVLTVTVN